MKGDTRKKTARKSELRKLAWSITTAQEFERIVASAGATEPTDLLKRQMREAVRSSLIPYLRPEVKAQLNQKAVA